MHHPVHENGPHEPCKILLLFLDVQRINFIADLSKIKKVYIFRKSEAIDLFLFELELL